MYLDRFYTSIFLAFALFHYKCEAAAKYYVTGDIGKVIEGKVVRIVCSSVDDSTPPPSPSIYLLPGMTPLQSSPHVTQQRIDTASNKTLVVTYNPIKLSDYSSEGFICGQPSSSISFNLYILPNASIPKVELTKSVGRTIGSKMTLQCNASFDKAGLGSDINMELKWLYSIQKSGNSSDITSEATKVTETTGSVVRILSTLTRTVGANTYGYYHCETPVILYAGRATYMYKKDVTVELPVTPESGTKTKQEAKIKKGKNVKFICKMTSFPSATVTWKKKDHLITASSDKRYKFSDYKTSKDGIFEIIDVDYADRAVYTCNASNAISFSTLQFTLRVRDPLGALWPFIGIVIEAIVLAVIIITYEKYRGRKGEKHGSKRDKKDGKEISPLLPKDGEPGVEYTSGAKGRDDSVRMRGAEEAKA